MIVVQRIRTQWTKRSRGGAPAARRNAVPEAIPVPLALPVEVVVHEVDAREWDGFAPTSRVRELDRLPADDPDGPAPVTDHVYLLAGGGSLRVTVAPPEARSPRPRPREMFALAPGEWGRWRFNGRFTPGGCSCHAHAWWYEKWVLNVAYLAGGAPADLFVGRPPARTVDHLVHLY